MTYGIRSGRNERLKKLAGRSRLLPKLQPKLMPKLPGLAQTAGPMAISTLPLTTGVGTKLDKLVGFGLSLLKSSMLRLTCHAGICNGKDFALVANHASIVQLMLQQDISKLLGALYQRL